MGAPPESPGPVDAELEALRARRRAELLDQQAGAKAEAPATTLPETLTTATFSGFVGRHPHVVVDVWAPWCGPCRLLSPILDELSRELGPRIRFGKLNADDEPGLAGRFGVQAIPTLLLFDSGRLVDRILGAQPREALRERFLKVFRADSAGS